MNPSSLHPIWEALHTSPLLWLTVTLVVYIATVKLYQRLHQNPLVLPVFTSVCAIVALLLLTETDYETYFSGVQLLHFLVGPATVALAIPLYHQLPKLVALWRPLSISLVIGALTGLLSSALLTVSLGASPELIVSLLPKSTTMPIAMAISEHFGGSPSLTAVSVALTGIIGSVIALPVFYLLRIDEPAARGVAMGVSAHAIGTARLIQIDEGMGAFSALAMSVTGVLTALFMPFVVQALVALQWL